MKNARNQLTNPEIGIRAAQAIRKMAYERDTTIQAECDRIGCIRPNFDNWEKGCAPSSPWLEIMALAGYDVIWILTGRSDTNER